MIFESHAHYDDAAFDKDRDTLLSSMPEHGIGTIVNVAADMDSSETTMELTKKYPFIYGAVGVHPSDVSCLNEKAMERLCELSKLEKCVAIGEIGLDYYWDKEDAVQKSQREWFVRQLDLARKVKLPVIIHSRDAAKDTLDIVKAENAEEIGGVVHCFSYSKEMAEEYLKRGFYIGIGGVVTFKNAKAVKEVVKMCPMERILLETDSPYLAPEPNRGKRNSSLNIPYIIDQIAELKKISADEVMEQAEHNAKKLFFGGRK